MNLTMVVLRLIHLFSGVFWAGAIFLTTAFLLPAVKATGPVGVQFVRQLAVQKLPVAIAMSAILTVLSGLTLFWRDTAMSAPGTFQRSHQGIVISIGALAALLALIPGIGIVSRTAIALSKLGEAIAAKGGPPSADDVAMMGTLQRRMSKGSHWTAGLVGIALFAMAIARYV